MPIISFKHYFFGHCMISESWTDQPFYVTYIYIGLSVCCRLWPWRQRILYLLKILGLDLAAYPLTKCIESKYCTQVQGIFILCFLMLQLSYISFCAGYQLLEGNIHHAPLHLFDNVQLLVTFQIMII